MGDNSWAKRPDPFGQGDKNPRWTEATRIELAAILASGHFTKAPTLERLFTYLVEQTLAGNGDDLKSYVVGVDGLGKDPDFDPNIDSYPRVQVLRLRKMLEAYYARHEPAGEVCLYIPAGSYGVHLARRARAYPQLIKSYDGVPPDAGVAQTAFDSIESNGESDDLKPLPRMRAEPAISSIPHIPAAPNSLPRGILGLITGLALSAALVASYLLWWRDAEAGNRPQKARAGTERPALVIERPGTSPDTASRAIAEEAHAKLADSISRSWVVRLLLREPGDMTEGSKDASYRLALQLGEPQAGQRPLYLRLTDSRTNELIWSSTARIDPARSLTDNLGKSIVQLAGPFGVIATRETRLADGKYAQGYSCLLGYVDFLKSQDVKLRAQLSNCLNKPTGNPRLDAVRLGLLSFHIVETAPPASRPTAVVEALALAQRAIRSDPKEAYAHFAMARIFFVTENCAMGALHTRHAAEANPYDPVLLAVLGNFASLCGDPEGDRLLAQAFELRSPGESYARLSLILAAIRAGRTDHLLSLSAEAENVPGANAAYHHLCETLIAAASGHQQNARAQWQEFAAVSAAPKGTPDEMMQRVVLSPQVRKSIIAYLRSKDVLR